MDKTKLINKLNSIALTNEEPDNPQESYSQIEELKEVIQELISIQLEILGEL